MTNADDALNQLIAPISTKTFFERYFEREILHVARDDVTYFGELYSMQRVEAALAFGGEDRERFRLIKHQAPELAREMMTSERRAFRFRSARQPSRDVLDPRRVLAAFADGYTIVINDAGVYHAPLAQLCNRIQAQLGFYVHGNVYVTPARAQGFDTHYDTHDTLIVQIEGEKHWQIDEPIVLLPIENQREAADAHDGLPGEPRQIHLRCGDSLYIPRGFPHRAATTESRSIHVTFAIAPLRVVDLLGELVQLAARDNVELRRALPPAWQTTRGYSIDLSARLTELLAGVITPERMSLAAERAYNSLFAATRTVAAGTFDALAAFERIAPGSKIRLRDDVPFQLRDRGERLDIVLASKVVSVPGAARAAFTLLASEPATFAQIEAVLPAGTGRECLRTLVMEGLILIDDHPSQAGS